MNNMPNLETTTNAKQQQNYTELMELYNKLDKQQREKFQQRLEKIIQKPVFPSQIERLLVNLNQENYDELYVYTRILLLS
jgi:DNA replication initiation complex subunit (GINS family)